MTTLREAAQQALEALEFSTLDAFMLAPISPGRESTIKAITALRAALAEPQIDPVDEYRKGFIAGQIDMRDREQAEPVQEPEQFDHGIGDDRFKVVRGAFWWHVLIGDSPTEHGKFRSRAGAEKMAADLLREFRNGAFVQHEAALAEPVQDGCDHCNHPLYAAIKCKVCGRVTEPVQEPYAWMSVGGSIWRHKTREDDVPLYAFPRTPLAEWQINDLMSDIDPEDTLRTALAEPDLFHCPQCGGPADNGHDRSIPPSPYFCTKCMAEPVQEPAAYIHRQGNHFEVSERHLDEDEKARGWTEEPLYTAPPQRKPEPNSDYERGFVDGMSEQARRSVDKAVNAMTKCKPLAEEEIARLVTNDMVKFARAIERAHGIGGEA